MSEANYDETKCSLWIQEEIQKLVADGMSLEDAKVIIKRLVKSCADAYLGYPITKM
jgi:hypothetical protein